jgi:cellulose synthase/poly-beta-1,6-N-acetylglucosamine synthase-like glycosyltransferase
MVEYIRSFTTARTGLDRMRSILILSGVFAVFEKDTVIKAGGYLTPFLRHRLTDEYVGQRLGTVCEDMEIIVRLHRFVLDKLLDRRILFLPHPVAWTEVPETFASLRKQRGRWFRGLRESLHYHHRMLFRPKYGRIGWFALPAFWLFEYLGPLIELMGYGVVLFLVMMEQLFDRQILSYNYLLAFFVASVGFGILLNIFAVLVGTWRFQYGLSDRLHRSLLPFGRRGEVLLLLAYAVLENFGYRQLTLYWRLRGLWDAWRGKTGWEKFAQVGFRAEAAAAHG